MELSLLEPRHASERQQSEGQSQGGKEEMTQADPTEDGPLLAEESESGEDHEKPAEGASQEEENGEGDKEPDVQIYPLTDENHAKGTERANDSDGDSGRDKLGINRFDLFWYCFKVR